MTQGRNGDFGCSGRKEVGCRSPSLLDGYSLKQAETTITADGLTEDIIAALALFPQSYGAGVADSLSRLGGPRRQPARRSARHVEVRYFAEGSIRRNAGQRRIRLRPADAQSVTLVWTDQYDTTPAS